MGRSFLLTLQYDGGGFAGWQRQPDERTVQAELEQVLTRLGEKGVRAHAAGRTDAGVHAVGMAVSCEVAGRWDATSLRRALNALLPGDVWIREIVAARPGFHARTCATARRYRYVIGTDPDAASPFRRRYEWALGRPLDADRLRQAAARLPGEHDFHAFSVRSSPRAHQRCRISAAAWEERPGGSGVRLTIAADRFLHHMIRMLVGTMVDISLGRRSLGDMHRLLALEPGVRTSPPAPPEGLFFVAADYPREWFACDG